VILPHSIGFNAPAAAELLAPVSAALGGSPGVTLFDFAARLGAPMKLKELGLKESDLDRAAEIAVRNPYFNPRPFDRAAIRALLKEAWEGARPQH
jgi:maleylacetate reductase